LTDDSYLDDKLPECYLTVNSVRVSADSAADTASPVDKGDQVDLGFTHSSSVLGMLVIPQPSSGSGMIHPVIPPFDPHRSAKRQRHQEDALNAFPPPEKRQKFDEWYVSSLPTDLGFPVTHNTTSRGSLICSTIPSIGLDLEIYDTLKRQVKLKSEIPPIMLRNFAPIAKFRIFLKFAQLSENCDFAPPQNLGKFKF
jgi:hypothetical protein